MSQSGSRTATPTALMPLVHALWENRVLTLEMARRELLVSNKGSILGFAWLIIRPFIQVASYVIIVSFIFKVHFGPPGSGPFGYAVYVLAGMVPWQIMTKALEESPSLIRSRGGLLTQIIFPLEILPLTTLAAAAIGPAVQLVVYLILAGITGSLHWTILFLPIPLAMLALMLLGFGWIFMVVGVLLKDLREIVSVVLGLVVYMSPVVLSEAAVGPHLWHILALNPAFHIIACFRDVFDDRFHAVSWVIFSGMTVAALVLGGIVVARAKTMVSEYI